LVGGKRDVIAEFRKPQTISEPKIKPTRTISFSPQHNHHTETTTMKSPTQIDSHSPRQRSRQSTCLLAIVSIATLLATACTALAPSNLSRSSKPLQHSSSSSSQLSAATLGTIPSRGNSNANNGNRANHRNRRRNNNQNIANASKRNTNKSNQRQWHQQRQQQDSTNASVFVKNLAYEATKEDIIQACERSYGPVEDVWIPKGSSKKGYASVFFKSANSAQKALQNGRLRVLGRNAYLAENTRKKDTQGDAFRFLAAVSKGDFGSPSKTKQTVLEAVAKAGIPRNQKETGILAASLARIRAKDELFRVLNDKSGTSVFNAALSALSVSDQTDCSLAKDIVKMAEQGPGVNARTYATAIASIKRGSDAAVHGNGNTNINDNLSKAASAFLQTAIDKGVANHVVYNELISCHGKKGAWKKAMQVLDQMFEDKDVEPTEVSLNAAINSCATCGEMDAAQKIYHESFKKAKLTPNLLTTNSLVSTAHRWIKKRRSLHRGGTDHSHHGNSDISSNTNFLDPSDAKKAIDFVRSVIQDASKRGDELDVISVNSLISTYGAAGDVQSAMKIFVDACKSQIATTVTANAALSALATSGEQQKALTLIHKLDTKTLPISSDTTSWNTAISACGPSGDWQTALQLLQEMPHKPDAHTFASMLSVIQPENDMDDEVSASSRATAESVNDLLSRADKAKATTTFVLNAALAALDRLGDGAAVHKLFEVGFEERNLVPDAISYNTVIYSLGKNDPALALDIFSQILQDQTLEPDEQTYGAVVSALAHSGLYEEALQIAKTCPQTLERIDVYNEALFACHNAGEPQAALDLLRDMETNGPTPNLVSKTIAMNACAKAGQHYEDAFALFDKLQQPDLICYNSAIALAEKAEDPDLAISYLTRLVRDPSTAPDAVSFCSAIAACERGENPRVRTALRLLKESCKAVGPNAACYIATAQTLAAAGEVPKAIELLDHDCYETFDKQSQYVLYRTIQVAAASSGDSEQADRIGQEMHKHNLKALAPQAWARIGGGLLEFDNKIAGSSSEEIESLELGQEGATTNSMAAEIANTVQDLVQQMNHEFVTSALPLEFQAHSRQKGQEISLANHAEKKALAQLLLEERKKSSSDFGDTYTTLSVEINFKMCADCHAFFKGASSVLDRRITVKEPTMLHVFEDGECSCKNSWRWEERHHASSPITIQKNPNASRRFGRLPALRP